MAIPATVVVLRTGESNGEIEGVEEAIPRDEAEVLTRIIEDVSPSRMVAALLLVEVVAAEDSNVKADGCTGTNEITTLAALLV